MRRAIIGSFAVLVLAALAFASDPWKSKPYQQWDDKDVQKVLSDSPWSRQIQVDATWQKDSGLSQPSLPQGSSGGGSAGGSGGSRGGTGGGGGSSSGGPGMGGGSTPSANGPAQAMFAVRWASSRTIREALTRRYELDGKMTQQQGDQQLAIPVDTYQVLLSGSDMSPFLNAEEASVKDKSLLVTKKSKEKIEASKVEFQKSPDGKTIYSILISFPKKTASGEATIGADEKGVEFTCSVAGVNLKTSFDVSKMYDSTGRDI
jgi:hypothetical protein